ncbi:MAG: heavy metal translocating P-type ATPase [Pseudomonadota bacterium]
MSDAVLTGAPPAEAEPARLSFSVPGMRCAGCVAAVEREASRFGAARVNLTLKRLTVDVARPDSATPDKIVSTLAAAGHRAVPLDADLAPDGDDPVGRDLLLRLAVAGFATMNVMLLSVAVWSGADAVTRDLLHWISAAIAVPTVAFAARPFFSHALGAVRAGRLNMDVPIALAILLAVGMSLYETSVSGQHAYFDAALALTFFLLIGRYLDHRTRARARSAAAELAALEVPRAERVVDGRVERVPVADLAIGDLVRVCAGERIPVDGTIRAGASELDRSLMTGESAPVSAGPGTDVHAGEVNLTGPLELKVTARGPDTVLRRMAEMVATAEASRTRATTLADRAAALYAPGVHILAAVAGIGWWLATGDPRIALNIATAVLIITCPCALGLAVPAVMTAASARLFGAGVLLKDGAALERLADVTHVVLDKTGTLTLGAPEMRWDDVDRDALAVAAALAAGSRHPLARSLATAADAAGVEPAPVTDIVEVPGHGIRGTWRDGEVRLGRAAWVGADPVDDTATYLSWGTGASTAFTFEDRLRDGAAEMVAALRDRGLPVTILTGDTAVAARALAGRLGIDDVRAELLPEDKAQAIAALEQDGTVTLMIGDGLNDTAALARATVSISPASGLDAARAASDIVVMGADLRAVVEVLGAAEDATARIRENFTIASAYNVLAVPLAMAGYVTPLIAALAMSASSIMVSLNAARMLRGRS